MPFLTTADFSTGKYKIAQDNYSNVNLAAYIAKYEPIYLRQLFGSALYTLFVSDLSSNVPQSARFTAVFNAFSEDDDEAAENTIIVSEGIREMLKGFVFFEYNRDLPVKNTVTGNVTEGAENSNQLNSLKSGIVEKYNAAVTTYQAIQWKMDEAPETYPEYNGVAKEIMWI